MGKKYYTRGFTLIEMSIVLVIIGLIVGAIVAGSGMVKAARLQSVIGDINRYKQAAVNFKDKYKYLPGDYPSASVAWPTAGNGNGDGRISGSVNASPLVVYDPYEAVEAWIHLADAKMIEGSYTYGGSTYVAGYNVPGSRIPGAVYLMFFSPPQPAVSTAFPGIYNHIIVFGKPNPGGMAYAPNIGAIMPSEALDIDQKIDDGMPGLGNVRSYPKQTMGWCTTSQSFDAEYNINATYQDCSLIFVTGF